LKEVEPTKLSATGYSGMHFIENHALRQPVDESFGIATTALTPLMVLAPGFIGHFAFEYLAVLGRPHFDLIQGKP
jgi:hypothetical protein